jgi:hypothetical protein
MVDGKEVSTMANTLPSAALCAHVHDSLTDLDVSKRDIDALVSQIYESSRTIELCKELAQLAKARICDTPPNLDDFHHLPFIKDHGIIVTDEEGFPYLRGKGWNIVNNVIHSQQSQDRDRTLILWTKLHAYVLPLSKEEGAKRTRDMINNIMTPSTLDDELLSEFRNHVRRRLSKMTHLERFNWRSHLRPLGDLAAKYYGSAKKKGGYSYDKEHNSAKWNDKNVGDTYDNFLLTMILANARIRDIYLRNKIDFLTLTLGIKPAEVVNDDNILMLAPSDLPIGRMGIRLQEAEKVRTLWMPLVIFESTIAPLTELLEEQVRLSRHQSTYIDDAEFAERIRETFFKEGRPAEQTIYSIDQSAFTDNFPYKLQRIVLEEYADICGIPPCTLEMFDLQVLGPYRPAPFFKMDTDITFAKGTPMGGEATFMLATHTHDLLIDMCYAKCHVPPRERKYCVQGDDAVILGDNVYQLYSQCMSSLGCTINTSKTLASNKAIEFCGWISTPEQSVPMFRPHDRHQDSVKDLLSPRAVQAFGEDKLVSWIIQERPDILDQAKVIGLIPIDPNDQVLVSAREVFKALSASSPLLAKGITREHGQRKYAFMEKHIPECRYDEHSLDGITSSPVRSSYDEYYRKLSKLRRLNYQLRNDPTCHLIEICNDICALSDDIKVNHKDYVSTLHPPKQKVLESEHEFIFKFDSERSKAKKTRLIEKTAQDSLEIANTAEQSKEGGMSL